MTKILIIEDDPEFRELLEIRLGSFIPDLDTTVCVTLEEARLHCKSLTSFDYALVILDQNLPDGKGINLLKESLFGDCAVLSVSSDIDPQMPAENLKAGAGYFLNKTQIGQPLFQPLILGLIDRNKIQLQLQKNKISIAVMESIKVLASTLRHEINNPLGAVLGGAYILKNLPSATEDQRRAAELVESSGQRIKHVLEQIISASSLEQTEKGSVPVFHIPGDKEWES